MRKILFVLLVFACVTVIAQTVRAQSAFEIENVPAVLGVGVGMVPDYRGSNDYTMGIAPLFRYTFKGSERYVAVVANELSVNLLNNKAFRLGPVVSYTFGRDDDVGDDQVADMEEIDGTVEAGVFADYAWIDPQNPRNRFLVGVTALTDVGGENDGNRIRLSARYWHQVAKAMDIGLVAGLWYADDDWTDTYFGVNSDNVGTSGLPFYTADGGVEEYYVGAVGIFYLSKNWALTGGVRYASISGDAEDSPLVDGENAQGDANQLMGGIGVAYLWW
jgi:outer membrane scaffolding protein for murein synthesis (MipA/OmpV family)